MKKLMRLMFLGFSALSLLLAACGGGSDDATGTVKMALTDAVDPAFESVTVAVREVRIVPAGEEGAAEGGLPLVAAFEPPMSVNVLDLAFRQEFLGQAEVPAGQYSQVRLVLAPNGDPAAPANYLVLAGTTEKIPLKSPSGQESGLKILGPFAVPEGGKVDVVLDFDPARAVVETGSGTWQIKPTGIRAVRTKEILPVYGALAGRVLRSEIDTHQGVAILVPVAGAIVSALPIVGETVVAAAEVQEDGTFRLPLPAGDFRVKIEVPGSEPQVLSTVYPIVQEEETVAGDLVL